MCDTLGFLADGGALFAKNSDRSPNEPQTLEFHPARTGLSGHLRATYISLPEAAETHAALLSRPAWMWGAEMGVNDCGVCIGNEAVFTRGAYAQTGLTGMDLLQAAVQYHLGSFGVIFIDVTLALFSFSTFIGILFYARSNVAYLFGDRWLWQTLYKVLALGMLLVGGVQAYTVVWDLGDVGIGLMTIFNLIALYPLSGEAIEALRDYERRKHLEH